MAQNEWTTKRAVALALATLHHGLSNFATKSVPAGWSTVIQTAEKFREYLEGNTPRDNRNGR